MPVRPLELPTSGQTINAAVWQISVKLPNAKPIATRATLQGRPRSSVMREGAQPSANKCATVGRPRKGERQRFPRAAKAFAGSTTREMRFATRESRFSCATVRIAGEGLVSRSRLCVFAHSDGELDDLDDDRRRSTPLDLSTIAHAAVLPSGPVRTCRSVVWARAYRLRDHGSSEHGCRGSLDVVSRRSDPPRRVRRWDAA